MGPGYRVYLTRRGEQLVDLLEKSAAALDTVDRETMTKVMEAFRPQENQVSKVA
jgi:putative component of toxin-antitoxin plasmid stabilization module